MIFPRLIPCLLLANESFVKTTRFSEPKYLGDPINIIKIFNDLEVDEVTVFDIEASKNGESPNFRFIEKLANECRMPLCYGGGVTSPEEVESLISIGVEKVSINCANFTHPDIIHESVSRVGSQSVVGTVDVMFDEYKNKFEIHTCSVSVDRNYDVINHVRFLEDSGVGEIIINTVHRDGTLLGYDYKLLETVFDKIKTPLTFLGGASGIDDILFLHENYKHVGAGVGSYFVLKGKFRAVLISYPSWEDRQLKI